MMERNRQNQLEKQRIDTVDPEKKRRIIGEIFIQIANKVIERLGLDKENTFIAQGTLRPDLIESGNEGLILALDNFDPDRGYYFISFAVWYIRREIIKAIYNTGRTIRYPITYISKITKVKKA